MTGNIMVVCFQCAHNANIWDIPADVGTMGAGLIIGSFHDHQMSECVGRQLMLEKQKVTNGEGRVYLEEPFWVLNKSSHTILAG